MEGVSSARATGLVSKRNYTPLNKILKSTYGPLMNKNGSNCCGVRGMKHIGTSRVIETFSVVADYFPTTAQQLQECFMSLLGIEMKRADQLVNGKYLVNDFNWPHITAGTLQRKNLRTQVTFFFCFFFFLKVSFTRYISKKHPKFRRTRRVNIVHQDTTVDYIWRNTSSGSPSLRSIYWIRNFVYPILFV